MRYSKVLLWGILSLLEIFLFFFIIPVSTYHNWSIFMAFMAAILSALLFTAFAISVVNMIKGDKAEEDDPNDKSGYLFFATIMIGIFVVPISLLYHISKLKTLEIEEHGVYTTGKIMEGAIVKGRKRDNSYLTILFTTADGRFIKEKHELPASVVDEFGLYQEVPLLYSKRYPEIFRVLRNKEEVAKYNKKAVTDLNLDNLLKLFSLKTDAERLSYLNSVNDKWQIDNGSTFKNTIYINAMQTTVISYVNKGIPMLKYIHNTFDTRLFKTEIETAGFVMNGTDGRVYNNEKFMLVLDKISKGDDKELPAIFKTDWVNTVSVVRIDTLDLIKK